MRDFSMGLPAQLTIADWPIRARALTWLLKMNKLAYLKDSNAAAHSVDSDKFRSSDSSICALQDLSLTFIS